MNHPTKICAGLALAAALALSGGLFAQQGQEQGQGQGQGQQPPKQPVPPQPGQPAPAAEPAAPPLNPEEEAAYKALFEVPHSDPRKQIELGEQFLKTYPTSRYNESVYSRLANAYLATEQEDKLFAAGEKALELNADNVDVLALLAWVLPRRVGDNQLDREQKLQKTERYSKRAMELLQAMTKPVALTEEQFQQARNEKLSMCHSGLGLVFFHRQKYPESVTEFEQATKLATAAEPTDFYLLGLAYLQTKQFTEAAGAFGRCGDMQWVWQDRCKQSMDQAQKQAAAQPAPPKP